MKNKIEKVLNIKHVDFGLYPIGVIKEFQYNGIDFFIHESINDHDFNISEKITGQIVLGLKREDLNNFKSAMYQFSKNFNDSADFINQFNKKIRDCVDKNGVANDNKT